MPASPADRKTKRAIADLVQTAREKGLFPGIEIFCAKGEQVVYHEAFGCLDGGPERQDLRKGWLFDLASLTKPLATAPAVVHLAECGKIDLLAPASIVIEEFAESGKSGLTIAQLLTHSAGFADWLPLFEPDFDRDAAWEQLIRAPLAYEPGTAVIYSCLGYIVLGELVRRLTGDSLAAYCRRELYAPLGIENLLFNPGEGGSTIVPTAYCPLRKKWLRGLVHDENAFTFNGEGGNAGLFGTAADIHAVCRMLLSSGRINTIFSSGALSSMVENQNPPSLPPRTFGWDVNDGNEEQMSCSDLMPPGSIGHLGFTGTSIWMDPLSKIIIILLSNRVNLSREATIPMMQAFRPAMHALLLSTLFQLKSPNG